QDLAQGGSRRQGRGARGSRPGSSLRRQHARDRSLHRPLRRPPRRSATRDARGDSGGGSGARCHCQEFDCFCWPRQGGV
ncbi:unnamed protein product, partial [Polarella glacialis]